MKTEGLLFLWTKAADSRLFHTPARSLLPPVTVSATLPSSMSSKLPFNSQQEKETSAPEATAQNGGGVTLCNPGLWHSLGGT